MKTDPEDIVNFWFYEVGPERWFSDDDALDETMRQRFGATYEQAAQDGLDDWCTTPEGSVGLLLLLDVFPRRMFRGSLRAVEMNDKAMEIARDAIIHHFDDRIDKQFKLFFYLPFLNSENIGDQRLALYYIRERAKEEKWLSEAQQRFETVQRFGRLPQLNPILGRQATPEEVEFLKVAPPSGVA